MRLVIVVLDFPRYVKSILIEKNCQILIENENNNGYQNLYR